jgi:hypothetical protein
VAGLASSLGAGALKAAWLTYPKMRPEPAAPTLRLDAAAHDLYGDAHLAVPR